MADTPEFDSSDIIGFEPEADSGGGTAVAEQPAGGETPQGNEYDIRDSGQQYPDQKPLGSEKPEAVPADDQTPAGETIPGQSPAGSESPKFTRELIQRAFAAGLDIDQMTQLGAKEVEARISWAESRAGKQTDQGATQTQQTPQQTAAPSEYKMPEVFARNSNPANLGIIPDRNALINAGVDETLVDAVVNGMTAAANHVAGITKFMANVHKWGFETDKKISDHKTGLDGLQNTLSQRDAAEATQKWESAKTGFINGLDPETKQFLADPLNEARLEQACLVLAEGYKSHGKSFALDALLKQGFSIEFPDKVLGAARNAGRRDVTDRDASATSRARAGGTRAPQKGDAAAIANWDEKIRAIQSR